MNAMTPAFSSLLSQYGGFGNLSLASLAYYVPRPKWIAVRQRFEQFPPERFFRKAQNKIHAGHYDFNVEIKGSEQ